MAIRGIKRGRKRDASHRHLGLASTRIVNVQAVSRNVDYPAAEDATLVKAAQKGDMQAFEELVARHRDKIYTRAFSMMRNEEEALDLSQEAWVRSWQHLKQFKGEASFVTWVTRIIITWVKSWQRLNQFQGEASFVTWITRIVINLCLDQLRRQKRIRADSIEQLDEESGGVERQMAVVHPSPTERLERHELRQRIDKALGQLSCEHRTALILHEFEDLEYKEIAKRMRCSIETVMSRLFYARRKMAVLLASLKREESRCSITRQN